VSDDTYDLQSIRFDIGHVRPSYDLDESDDPSGFKETLTIMIRGVTTPSIEGASGFGLIHIKASREMEGTGLERIMEDSSRGVGLATSTTDGLVVLTLLPFDAAWRVADAIHTGQIGKAVVECDPIEGLGAKACVRSVRFMPA
jgi:hypothetical protein